MVEKKVTPHNICQTIEDCLKSKKIRFSISDSDSKGLVYELYISSIECYIQVEYDLDVEDDDYIVLQLFDKVDYNGNSVYHSDWDNEDENADSVEGEIENLIEAVKRINQGVGKINAKIEQIKDICEEYNLEFEEFITLNYDFDK
jgi:hypothetical protein